MVQIYWLEYQDVANVTHRLEIDAPDTYLGDELVTNGNFKTDSDWTKGSGWTISNGVAELVFTTGALVQDSYTYLNGKTYEITYDLLEISTGSCRPAFVGASTTVLTSRSEAGTYTEQITMNNDKTEFKILSNVTAASFIVDNVSIKEVIAQAETQEINGNVIHKYSSAKEHLTPIRGSGLDIRLEANVNLTFEDLYSEEERTYSVTYYRDSIVTFNGWIDPEGLFQDYVRDKWIITLQCVDGLGFLNNLSFVNPLTSLPILGKQKELDIIAVCLKRTSILQNINTSIGLVYDGLTESLNVLDNAHLNAGRFIKSDNNTIMSCKEVLNDLLEVYGASIASINGEWYIYKVNELYLNNSAVDFFRYDSEGVALSPTNKTVDLSEALGSQIDGFYPHHCNENQKMDIDASVGAYRVDYKYGITQSLINNTLLTNIGGVLADWNIIDATWLTLPASGESSVDILSSSSASSVTVLESDKYSVPINFESVVSLIVKSYSTINSPHWMRIEIILTETAPPNKNYYYGDDGLWHYDTPQSVRVDNITSINRASILSTINVAATPVIGEIFVRLLRPFKSGTPDVDMRIDLLTLNPKEVQGQDTPIGETHTIQRTSKPSSKIADTEEVFNGDNPSDVWEGTIYKADEITPTETWHRIGFDLEDTDKPLLQIMAEEKIRMNAKPSRIFSGSIFGWFSYLSVFTISGVNGLFMFLEYSYNSKANVITAKFKEIQGDELTDMYYSYALTYKDAENPTIGN